MVPASCPHRAEDADDPLTLDAVDDDASADAEETDAEETDAEEPQGSHGSTKAVLAALAANLGIAVAKLVGFAITGSASMLAESIHSVADSGNQGLLLLGGSRARRAPDERHPFGYGRERYFWAFVVALVLFTLGGAFAIVEGIEKVQHPHEVDAPGIAIAILLVAMLLEGGSFRTAVGQARELRGEATWWQFIRRSRNPELPVVLLEDFGALIGLTFAVAGVVLALVTDDGRWDGIGSLAIGTVLCCLAGVLAIEMKSLLVGESALRPMREAIRTALVAEPEVERLIHLRTEHLGPEQLLVGAKLSFRGDLTIAELATTIDRVEARVRAVVPEACVLYIEPDVFHPELVQPDRPEQGAV
jgi:cation diffusion facilitator family transporter